MNKPYTKNISVSKLVSAPIRDLRPLILNELRSRIDVKYNMAKSLSVIDQDNDTFLVADGNHRLVVINEKNIDEVSCLVYPKGADLYEIGISSNADDDAHGSDDLFDKLRYIGDLKGMGLTHKEIGGKIGWSKEKVDQYGAVLSSILTENLKIAKSVQTGRVSDKLTNVSFTEGWFREILKLAPDNQKAIIQEYIDTKGKLKGQKLTKQVEKLLLHETMIQYVCENLVDQDLKENFTLDINNGLYKTIKSLEAAVLKSNEAFKERNQIQIYHGDAFELFGDVKDKSVDLILTDPPYNVTENEWDKFESDEAFFDFIKKVCVESKRVLKDDYQFYMFMSSKYQADVELILRKFFDIKSRMIWVRKNMSMGRVGNNKYLPIYDIVFHCGNKELNFPSEWGSERFDVQEIAVPQSNFKDKKVHPTQKPIELVKNLVELSTHIGDVVLDPFAGSGTTVVACKNLKRQCIAFEADGEYFKIMESRLNE